MEETASAKTKTLKGIEYEICPCCGKPKRGTGKNIPGHAIFVVKSFVRGGSIVDFPGQWRALCESVGFVTLHEHHASLVRDNGTSLTLDGGEVRHIIKRASFFRRLAEKKGSPEINWETVLCMTKPE